MICVLCDCKFEMDIFGTHVFDIVFNLSMYEMLVLEFLLRSPMNKLSKANRVLWVFQLNIHGGSAPDNPLGQGITTC